VSGRPLPDDPDAAEDPDDTAGAVGGNGGPLGAGGEKGVCDDALVGGVIEVLGAPVSARASPFEGRTIVASRPVCGVRASVGAIPRADPAGGTEATALLKGPEAGPVRGVARPSGERDGLAGAGLGYREAGSAPAGIGCANEDRGRPLRFEPLDDVEPAEPSRTACEPRGDEADGSPRFGKLATGVAGTPTGGLSPAPVAGAVGTTTNFAGGRISLAGVGRWPAHAGGAPSTSSGPVGRIVAPAGLGPIAELELMGPLGPPRVGSGTFRSEDVGSPALGPITAGRATTGVVPDEPFPRANTERSIPGNREMTDDGRRESERDGNDMPGVLVEEIVTDGRAMVRVLGAVMVTEGRLSEGNETS
jgi:hypothetical protein